MNIVHEGDVMPAYYGAVNTSCTLDRCLAKVHEMINWDEKYPRRDMGNGKIRAVGMGMAMQGSGISGMDVGSATLKVNDEGFYTLLIGAADMGTGCDTTLAQIAAEVLECGLDDITRLRCGHRHLALRFRLLRVQHHLHHRQSRREVRAEAAEPDLQAGRTAAGLQRK